MHNARKRKVFQIMAVLELLRFSKLTCKKFFEGQHKILFYSKHTVQCTFIISDVMSRYVVPLGYLEVPKRVHS